MNLSVKTKWIFLSFLQQWFKDHPTWTWTADPRTTKIIIADKFATEIGVAAHRPSIILDRGPIGWTGYFRNEAFPISRTLGNSGNTLRNAYSLTDIIQGSITLNVTAKSPYEADELANLVFYLLSAFREWFKEKGIFKMNGLSIGQESIVQINAGGPQVTLVQVRFSFQKQETVNLYWKQFEVSIFLGDDSPLQEGVDYIINPNGQGITLTFSPKAGEVLKANYTDAVTLAERNAVSLILDEETPGVYSVPNNEGFYGHYKIFETFVDNTTILE